MRHENQGLALLLTVDSLIRKKVHRLNHDQRKIFPTALLEVLKNHKQLWNDSRSSAELDKFKQARASKRAHQDDSPASKMSPKAKKNKARRDRQKAVLAQAKAPLADPKVARKDPKVAKDARVPANEWSATTAFRYSGKRRCPFYNCSLECRFGDSCRNLHVCVECGKEHPWHGNH